MKRLICKILREEIEKSDKHYRILDKISNYVETPYFKSMEGLTIYEHNDQEYIMRKILGNIRISTPPINLNYWDKMEYDDKGNINDEYGNEIYYEDYDGSWVKKEFNENGNMLYFERSDGYWMKKEYDGNEIDYDEGWIS